MNTTIRTIIRVFIFSLFFISIPRATFAAVTENLSLGSKGSQVSELQTILIEKGFLTASDNTGFFGKKTQVAVKKFQTSVGLSQVGRVGSATREKLNNQDSRTTRQDTQAHSKKPRGNYTEFVSPTGFVNTGGQAITMSDYIGKKVIVVSFITYSCINCQRTLPFMNDWYTKYKDKGVVVIGIHAPEFAFEKNIKNVEKELGKMGVKFPVVLDNNFDTWNAYKNQFWPHRYVIDLSGNVVYDHIGEGAYEETENAIKKAAGL